MWLEIWLRTTDSNSFYINGKWDMCLKLGTSVIFYDIFFNKCLIMVSLNTVLMYPSSIDVFILSVVRGLMMWKLSSSM